MHATQVSRPRSASHGLTDLLFFFFTLVTGTRRSLSLKLSDTRVYEPQIRVRLGTTEQPLYRNVQWWLTTLQLTCWLCGTRPSTLERARNRCNQMGEAKPTEPELEHDRHRLRQSYKTMSWIGATCPDRRAPGLRSPCQAPRQAAGRFRESTSSPKFQLSVYYYSFKQ